MTRIEKLTKRFLKNPQSLKYSEIEKILLRFGFTKIQAKGSHIKFYHPIFFIKFTISIHNNECKKIYKKEVAETLRRLIG